MALKVDAGTKPGAMLWLWPWLWLPLRDCNPRAIFFNPGIRDRGISNSEIPMGLLNLPLC